MSELLAGEKVPFHDFEKAVYFEGCLPIEAMAERGIETLRHGPMKPFGLRDPRTGREPYAVVQLRQDDLASEHWNLVGFQTKLKVRGSSGGSSGRFPGLAGGRLRPVRAAPPEHLHQRAGPPRPALPVEERPERLLRRTADRGGGVPRERGDGADGRRDARAAPRREGAAAASRTPRRSGRSPGTSRRRARATTRRRTSLSA